MKKVISLILSIVMLTGVMGTCVLADENEISVYVTASKYGEILTDKNDEKVAMTKVTLSGESEFELDDVLYSLHENAYEGGAHAGYATATGDYGLYVSKFWGDESENFIYLVNSEFVMGPAHIVENGDIVEFFINKNSGSETEIYTKFDAFEKTVYCNDTVELCLSQAGFTADGTVFSACEGATITVDSVLTDNVTDEEGKTSVLFQKPGRYIISAIKTKLVEEENVTSIAAPFCIVTVEERPEVKIIHNIVEKYFNDSIADDENFCWFIADFAHYLTLFPDSGYEFSKTQKQAFVDKIIEFADNTVSQGDLAQAIIALRALGYDAKNTYTKNGELLDIAEKLTEQITEESVQTPYYEYALPYVMIALQQGENYADSEMIDFLIDTAISIKSVWQYPAWGGIDGATPMLRALAPYYEDVKSVIDETVELVLKYQSDSGAMGNAASTGIAIAGLSAVGINPIEVISGEKNIIDGLMSQINENTDGFLPVDNSFATEQGLRGLISWKLFEFDKYIYDFSDYPLNEARATLEKEPEISGSLSMGGGGSAPKKNKDDAEKKEGQQEQAKGLPDKNKDVLLPVVINSGKTFDDIKEHKNREAIEQLAEYGIINGKNEKEYAPEDFMTRAEFATIVVRSLGLPDKIGKTFLDISEKDWFFGYINTASYYGIVNGVSDNSFNPAGTITREEAATMVSRASSLCGMDTKINEDGIRNILSQFTDYKKSSVWAMNSLAFCYNELILDDSEINIEPKLNITRAEVAQMLYNMLGCAEMI